MNLGNILGGGSTVLRHVQNLVLRASEVIAHHVYKTGIKACSSLSPLPWLFQFVVGVSSC